MFFRFQVLANRCGPIHRPGFVLHPPFRTMNSNLLCSHNGHPSHSIAYASPSERSLPSAKLLPPNDGVLARSDDARRPPAVSATRSLILSAATVPMPLARFPAVPAARLTARFAPLSELPPNPAAWANGLLPVLLSAPALMPAPPGLLFDIPPMLGMSLPLDIEACALSNAAFM